MAHWGLSIVPTPYAVICPQHSKVYLTHTEYIQQLDKPGTLWKCPLCRRDSDWDNLNYDTWVHSYE